MQNFISLTKLNSKPCSQMTAVCSVDASGVAIYVPDPPIGEEPPALTKAISKLKGRKVASTCGAPTELLMA